MPIDFSRMTFTDLLPMALNMFTEGGATAVFNYLNPFPSGVPTDLNPLASSQLEDTLDKIEWEFEALQNPVVSLLVNPQNINVDKKIVSSKIQTKGGFVVQFWGHDLTNITVKSQTGSFAVNKKALDAFNLLKRHVYEKRFSTRQSFKGMPIISMIWGADVFQGYFNDFKYSFDATKPYVINYEFSFTITTVLTIPYLTQIANLTGAGSLLSPLTDGNGRQHEGGWGIPLG